MAGRPSKYDPRFNKQVFKLCLLGAKDTEIADFLEIQESTLNNWKKEYPELMESLKKGKIQADADVSKSLYRRAIGYSHKDTYFSNYEGFVTATPTIKRYPPDPTSAIFWLKNRRSNEWKDKHEMGLSVTKGQSFKIDGQTIEF